LARYRIAIRRHVESMIRDQMQAEDLTQEVFWRVWTRADTWDGRGSARAWLFRIATNQALNYLRTQRRRREEPLNPDRPPPITSAEDPDFDFAADSMWPTDLITQGPEMWVALAEKHEELQKAIAHLPPAGIFYLQQQSYVVIPSADSARLDQAVISCVGEQLLQYISERLGRAPAGLPWDEELLRTWLPLDKWITEFLVENGQVLEETNWLSKISHLRRLRIMEDVTAESVVTSGHNGRVCPVETPEGPNCGQMVAIAVGATISDRQLVIIENDKNDENDNALAPAPDPASAKGLGVAAQLIPFIEHDDAARALFGANMMRQALVLPDAEPALVQTGCEPLPNTAPCFWTGRNLLTAFISWGEATFGDGIVVSESAARRLSLEGNMLEPGDKIANRHGSKGVISAILPDREMPRLADGTPVDLIYSFIGLHTRLNIGQQLEALAGRIAHCTGQPVVAPPFQAPGLEAIQEHLAGLDLPRDGMEQLYDPVSGRPLGRRSLVGYVYWLVLSQRARPAMHVFTKGEQGQLMGRMEYAVLRDAGAYGFIAEQLHTRSTRNPDTSSLPARLTAANGEMESPVLPTPTPAFVELQKRLAAAGVHAELDENHCVKFSIEASSGEKIVFAQPIPHPWLPELQMKEIGIIGRVGCGGDIPGYEALKAANVRLYKAIAGRSPASLVQQAAEQLAVCVRQVCDQLVRAEDVHLRERGLFSGRAVISPAMDLGAEQVGVPEEMAWQLFCPAVLSELSGAILSDATSSGSTTATGETGEAAKELAIRSEAAQKALDKVMARSWVVINRAPTTTPTAIMAFRPVRCSGHVIRLHPMVCEWLNADFDGDQVAIFLPVTKAGQHDAEHKLSIKAHLERQPNLLEKLLPRDEAMWGLAWLSLEERGRNEFHDLFGKKLHLAAGYLNRSTLHEQCRRVLLEEGIDAVLELVESLWRIGFAAAKASGASFSLCPKHEAGGLPPAAIAATPATATTATAASSDIDRDNEIQLADLAARTDFRAEDLGPQLLAVKCGARGNINQLAALLFGGRALTSSDDSRLFMRRGYLAGLSYEEWVAAAADTWRRFVQFQESWERMAETAHTQMEAGDHYGVFARARRSSRPGVVFARAAVNREVDPLADIDSRLFVGVPPLI